MVSRSHTGGPRKRSLAQPLHAGERTGWEDTIEKMEPTPDASHLDAESDAASRESSLADVPGSPTWPITEEAPAIPPPVGLNWQAVSARLGMDLRILEHEGQIVLEGESSPSDGFFIDPDSFAVISVGVGDKVPRHGYFLGRLTVRGLSERLAPTIPETGAGLAITRELRGPVIGLFASEQQAKRARTAILQGSMGAGLRLEPGPLGIELRVARPEQLGMVATLIAANGGAVISIAGKSIAGAGNSS
jgi:hypothetical protein